MKTAAWTTVLMFVGAVLSLKDANWLGNPTKHNLGVMVVAAMAGALLGLCIGRIVKHTTTRLQKLVMWVCAFTIVGFALGHGNVPWSTTLKIIGYTAIVGLVVGSAHYLLSGSPRAQH